MNNILFNEVFGRDPAVHAEAPGRVNLLGEHTDYNDGFVLPIAIPQKTAVAVAPNGRDVFRVYSATLAELCEFSLQEAPGPHFASYVYGCLKEFSMLGGAASRLPPLDIYIDSSVPMGAGLSSSAALEVAVLRALREVAKSTIDDVSIALMAQRAERNFAGVNCGIMDQMASSLADESAMLFLDTRTLERKLLPLPDGAEILVMHSGIERSLADSTYNLRREECTKAAELMGVPSLRDATLAHAERLDEPYRKRACHVLRENARVLQAMQSIDATSLGRLMNASHDSLRDEYQVSVPLLDQLVGLLQGLPDVFGAKLTGAGFGGACVALVRRGAIPDIAAATINAYAQQGGSARVLVPVAE